MIRRRLLALTLVLALCPAMCPAVLHAIPPEVRVTQLVVDTWTTNDGLPQDRVQTIAQTRDGLLWVGTEAGLARFDGHRFVVFSPPGLPSIRNESITALRGTRDGCLYIGTRTGSLIRVASGEALSLTWDAPGTPPAVWDIAEDERGLPWIATGDGVYRVTGNRIVPVARDAGPVFALDRSPGGVWWFGGRRGLFQWSGNALRHLTPADGYKWGRISSLRTAPDGSLWVALRSSGLVRYRNGRWQAYGSERDAIGVLARAVAVDRHGHAWVGTWNGLARVEGGGFSSWGEAKGRMPTGIDAIFEDRDGVLWVGTMGGGLYRIRQGAVTTYTVTEGLTRDDMSAVCASPDGGIWAGAGDAGVNHRTSRGWERVGMNTPLGRATVWSCAVDQEGVVWFGTGSGLFRARGRQVEQVILPGSDADALVYSMFAGHSGDVWVSVDAGMFRITRGRPFKVELPAENGIDSLLGEGLDGTIYMSGARGLFGWRRGTTSLIWPASDAAHKPISMHVSEDGTLWIGTAGAGLLRHREGRATLFGRAAGLPDLTVAAVLNDGHGFLWLATHAGLARISRSRLASATDAARLDPIVYTVRDGLRSHYADERAQPAGIVAPSGRLWISTTRGLAQIDPSRLPARPSPTGVFVDDVEVDGRRVIGGGVAPPGRGALQVRFSASGRISSPHIRFRYRLEGFDPGWIEAGRSRVATYTNVPPGRYRFVVGAADETGDWAADEAALPLVLSPHWYQTWWLQGLAIAAVLGAAVAVPVLRARKARRDADSLARVVRDRTADLRLEIDERRQVEVALRASERRLRQLAEELDVRVQDRTSALQEEIAERERTEAQLIIARDAAEAALRAKSAFLANMSHELRTPLNAVIGYSELLQEEAAAQGLTSFNQDLGRIRGSGQHLLALVSDVLDLARIEAERVTLVPVTFDVHALVQEVVESVMSLAARRGNLLYAVGGSGPAQMTADALRVKQVLLNLLSNACKFTENGTITIEARQLTNAGTPWTVFEVRDTGIGIAEEDLPKLFIEFSQVCSSERSREGAGLGLAISRRLCTLMGGTITVESRPGQGTTFLMRLPAAAPPPAAVSAPQSETSGCCPAPSRRRGV